MNWRHFHFKGYKLHHIFTIHGRIGLKKSKYWACNASCLFCRRPNEIFISDESKCRQHWLSTIWCHVLKAHFLKAEAKIICEWPMCIIGYEIEWMYMWIASHVYEVYDPNHHDVHLDRLGLSYARMKITQGDTKKKSRHISL